MNKFIKIKVLLERPTKQSHFGNRNLHMGDKNHQLAEVKLTFQTFKDHCSS